MYIFLLKNSRFVTNTVFVFTAWAALVSTHLVMETVTRNDMFLNLKENDVNQTYYLNL